MKRWSLHDKILLLFSHRICLTMSRCTLCVSVWNVYVCSGNRTTEYLAARRRAEENCDFYFFGNAYDVTITNGKHRLFYDGDGVGLVHLRIGIWFHTFVSFGIRTIQSEPQKIRELSRWKNEFHCLETIFFFLSFSSNCLYSFRSSKIMTLSNKRTSFKSRTTAKFN